MTFTLFSPLRMNGFIGQAKINRSLLTYVLLSRKAHRTLAAAAAIIDDFALL